MNDFQQNDNWRQSASRRLRRKKKRESIVSNLPSTEWQGLFDVQPKPQKKHPVHDLLRSFSCALRGIQRAVKSERNLRIHTVAVGYTVAAGVLGQFSLTSWALVLLCFALVIGAELFNTSIEYLCNKTAPGFDQFIRDAKDTAAAAVLVCAMVSVVVGVLLLLQNHTYRIIWHTLTAHIWAFPALLIGTILAVRWCMRR